MALGIVARKCGIHRQGSETPDAAIAAPRRYSSSPNAKIELPDAIAICCLPPPV